MYKTYMFKDKDPVIDILRTAIQLEADAAGIRFSKMLTRVAHDSNVSLSTLYNWFSGPTRQPKYCCVAAVANAVRLLFYIGDTKRSERKRAA